MRRGTLLVGWTLAVLAMLAFASLGRWQLGRMHEKQAMLDAVQAVLAARDARPLSAAAGAAQGYDWVAGEGVFAEPLILLDNQQRDGRAGVRAFRVFDPQDGVQPGAQAPPLLVELGWLPLPGDRTLPQLPRPEGTHAIAGLLVPPPSQGLGRAVLAAQEDGTLLATGLDIDRLRDTLGLPSLAPRLLKLDPALPLGHARDLDILPNTLPPGKHLGYAVQWFGLALAVLVTALVLTFRKRRP